MSTLYDVLRKARGRLTQTAFGRARAEAGVVRIAYYMYSVRARSANIFHCGRSSALRNGIRLLTPARLSKVLFLETTTHPCHAIAVFP